LTQIRDDAEHVLVADPCSLLDPVAPAHAMRFAELAKDHDGQRGGVTDASRCEARLALTLEAQGLLDSTVVRPPWGEAEDGLGQIWDFKAPRCRAAIAQTIAAKAAIGGNPPPPVPPTGYPGEFDVATEVTRAIGQQRVGKGVVFDLRRLTVEQARKLIAAVQLEARLDPDLVRFFPRPMDLSAFEGGVDV
jgi:hypothetical protein